MKYILATARTATVLLASQVAPLSFYNKTNRKNTLFGSPNNNFTVENGRGYPIYRNLEGLPLGCKFLTSEQKEYLADKFQEIERINDEILEVKDPKEKAELSKSCKLLTKNSMDGARKLPQ